MHVLIADDETPARDELRYILVEFLPQATFYEAKNGEQVLATVEREPVEVVFLDINMPGLDGLATAAALLDTPAPPLVVFATAYDEHAVRAFELSALDYVVKPFDERRLEKTVERLRQTLQERGRMAQQHELLRAYLQEALPATAMPPKPAMLWGERENENRVLVNPADVLWIMAEDKKVYLFTAADEKLLIRQTLKELEDQLAAHNFARVHKGYLVNLQRVSEAVPWFSGGYLLRIDNAERSEIPVSRRYAAQLKKEIGLY